MELNMDDILDDLKSWLRQFHAATPHRQGVLPEIHVDLVVRAIVEIERLRQRASSMLSVVDTTTPDPFFSDSLCVPAGETLVRHVRFLAADGTPLNVSDPSVSIRWQIITPEGTEILKKSLGEFGVAIVSASDGLVRLVLTPDETRRFAPGLYHDIARVTLPGGVFARSTGRLEILAAPP